jgi:hypothetical protein
MFPDDLEGLKAFKPPAKPQYVLVSSLDAIALLRNDIKSLMDEKDLQSHPPGSFGEFPNHAILDRGRLIGLWEFDTETEKVVWSSFGVKDKALEAAVAATEQYVREQLGDARSFSLDSPKSRALRIAALRKSAGSAR